MTNVPLPHPAEPTTDVTLAVMLAPLVIATDSVRNAIAALVGVLVIVPAMRWSAALVSRLDTPVREVALAVIAAGFAASAHLLLAAFAYPVWQAVPFLALVLVASAIVTDLASLSASYSWPRALATVAVGLIVIGIAREAVGHGSLLHDARGWSALQLFQPELGFFLAALAPGAFIALALLLAGLNYLRSRKT